MQDNDVTILGAGLVGSLLATLLAERGITVDVYEKRKDPESRPVEQGRSINLALSHRGIRSLQLAGVYDQVQKHLIPMKGRMMHDVKGNLSFQSYGREDQHINSVSRAGLNYTLIEHARAQGVNFHFDSFCQGVNLEKTTCYFEGETVRSNVLIGSDGAFSVLRQAMQRTERFNLEQYYIPHGYKELTLHPQDGDFALEPNYLHIWPRGNFMLIALPNPDKSFTCTLFFPFEGDLSFQSIQTEEGVLRFFEQYFPDVLPLMPNVAKEFIANPTSSLVTIKTSPWHRNNSLLIGDASHAIVPFYGQGMNAGFEDCRLLIEWGEKFNFDWKKLLPHFSTHRKRDADAISDLAMKNFVEMRDKVADERFLKIKKFEARLQQHYPDTWLPLYTMVTFSDIPYAEAKSLGELQAKLMAELPDDFDPETHPMEGVIARFNALKQGAQ
ncbi:FAD-dependent oxidoreductase [Marinoscillum furvescens]|uniref:Kynurenine 3-monooxygenase n=1 Tax=Marinoscillum furvescens DSM 4134 TaxID=1122208 RepID=A0A3D9KYM3_MARFU|nr:NAD(P)/FAD-dependent oxidoreductase [Marinoscillum furvescens]RED93631.1 kynurenine 3-monooxygenase [Marinoscillum furvescens DSM 4134]